MKRKSIVLLCIVLCLIIFGINVRFLDAQEKINLFDEILLETKCEVSEYGLQVKFETRELPKEVCNYIFRTLDFDNKEIKSRIFENEDSYSIEFSGGNFKGYIQALKINNKDVITVNMSKIGNENGLVSLKNKVSVSIGHRGENIKYYQYLKAKIGENSENVEDIYSVNESIIKILESHGTKNIETVNINSGLSTVAYTKNYNAVVNNNKLIDFNYAVCNYSSGRYIILGTPEIITTY
jgi:hypothetical protein